MIERKCAECGNIVQIDKENSHHAIHYKSKFYHFECFGSLCDTKIQSKRTEKSWTVIKEQIDDLVVATTEEQRSVVAKDDLCKWISDKYGLSFISQRLYMKLASIYDGTYRGLAYPIPAEELCDEWQFYWQDLCDIRQYKSMFGEQAVNYDLAILLSKNSEYRAQKQREIVAREVQKQQREEEVVIDAESMALLQKNFQRKNTNSKRANLFEEVMGDGN